jgi:hypothetical protein
MLKTNTVSLARSSNNKVYLPVLVLLIPVDCLGQPKYFGRVIVNKFSFVNTGIHTFVYVIFGTVLMAFLLREHCALDNYILWCDAICSSNAIILTIFVQTVFLNHRIVNIIIVYWNHVTEFLRDMQGTYRIPPLFPHRKRPFSYNFYLRLGLLFVFIFLQSSQTSRLIVLPVRHVYSG